MLVAITEKCSNGCLHCMDDCTPAGRHMEYKTFTAALDFMRAARSPYWFISGGEPTEHPEFMVFLKEAKRRNPRITLLSNGHFLDNVALTRQMISLNIQIHVCYDPRYYPKPVDLAKVWTHRNISLIATVPQIFPLGRAAANGLPSNVKAPRCYSLRYVARHRAENLAEAIRILRLHGRVGAPHIDIHGNIRAGESNVCHILGDVSTPPETIFRNLQTMSCNLCGQEDKLSPQRRKALYGSNQGEA